MEINVTSFDKTKHLQVTYDYDEETNLMTETVHNLDADAKMTTVFRREDQPSLPLLTQLYVSLTPVGFLIMCCLFVIMLLLMLLRMR